MSPLDLLAHNGLQLAVLAVGVVVGWSRRGLDPVVRARLLAVLIALGVLRVMWLLFWAGVLSDPSLPPPGSVEVITVAHHAVYVGLVLALAGLAVHRRAGVS